MKSMHEYVPEPHYFGKYQRIFSIFFLILTFQGPFFAVIGLSMYALITLDFNILAILIVIIIISYPIKRS